MNAKMLWFALLIAANAVMHADTASEQVDWSLIYRPAALPDESGWGASKGENTSAEITSDGLHIVDAGTERTQLHCYSRSWGARPERGAVVEATVKVVSCTSRSGMCIHTSDGEHEDGLTLYPDRIELSHAKLAYTMDTTDGFHTYRIRIRDTDISVYMDGELVIDGTGQFTAPAHNGRRVCMFGSISSASTGEAYWRGIRYRVEVIPATRWKGASDVIIYRKKDVYACFPTLCKLADGRLYASFGTRVRRSHIDNTGGAARALSADEGRTWQLTDERHSDPAYIRSDGTRIVPHARGWIYVDETELPKVKQMGRRWMHARKGCIAYLGDPLVSFTTPDGKTRRLELPCPAPAGVMGFHHACSFVRLGNVWLRAIYGGLKPKGKSGVWGIRSEDDGDTWAIVTIADPLSAGDGFNETAVCDNGRNELIAVMRPKREGMNSYQCFSDDKGKTWSTPEDTGFWGYPSHLLLLQDGRLLCTRGYRRDAMGIRATLSNDGGHTWDVANGIVVRCDGQGNGGDNGYPISTQLRDGHIFTIYYINDEHNVTHVAGTHWDLPAPE